MTRRDLREYYAPERKPTHVSYRGLDVFGMGPPSSGGSTVGEALNILEGVPRWSSLSKTEKYHWFLEASRFAYADERRALIDPLEAQPGPVAAGNPTDNAGPSHAASVTATTDPLRSTTHLTVTDRWGGIVT